MDENTLGKLDDQFCEFILENVEEICEGNPKVPSSMLISQITVGTLQALAILLAPQSPEAQAMALTVLVEMTATFRAEVERQRARVATQETIRTAARSE